MKKLLALLLTVMMVLGLAACGGEPAEEAKDPDAKVITIGIFQPTTGQNGAGGKKEILGIEYAHSLKPTIMLNGEEYAIEFVVADNGSDNSKAVTAAQQLISKGAVAVLGSYGSGCSIAGGPHFLEAQVPAIGTSCTNPQVTAGNDYYFRVCYIDPFQGTVLGQYARDLGIDKVAVVVEAGDDYSDNLGKYFTAAFEKLGGTVVATDFQSGETDFSGMMANLASQGITSIFSPVSIETAPYIVKQARDAGIDGLVMAGDTWDDVSIIQRLEEAGYSTDGIIISSFFDESDESNEAAASFADGFKEWINADPSRFTDNSGTDSISSVTACGYDAYMAIYAAIEKAQSLEGPAIRDALASLEVEDLVTGDLSFDENGDAVKHYAVVKTPQDGQCAFKQAVTIE